MSELTKLAEIIAKHLSNAFLSMASDFRNLNDPAPLSQTEEKRELVSMDTRVFTKREKYKAGDRVMVMLEGALSPIKFKILEVSEGNLYLAYTLKSPKNTAREITHDQIQGLDPDR